MLDSLDQLGPLVDGAVSKAARRGLRFGFVAGLVVGVALSVGLQSAMAKRIQFEDVYNRAWCAAAHGTAEVRQNDRSRVDCLTSTVAWETDFAEKWFEALGQASHYARKTGRLPGLLLIIETPNQCWRLFQARETLARVWYVRDGVMYPYALAITGNTKLCFTTKGK